MSRLKFACFAGILLILMTGYASAQDTLDGELSVDQDLGKMSEASRTDDEVVKREEERILLDSLNVSQMNELREKAEKRQFQAEVNRMMKLIINSLYRNKEIFLRELISNASDALDKIRVMSLTDKSALKATEEMSIRIKADKDNNVLHVIDTGVGMTKQELIDNLGTIAKSGTHEFLQKVGDGSNEMTITELNDLIGQFGVGFYSSFLVADTVVVTSKSNDDPEQHIWESDSNAFTVVTDPRGPTLKRGTQVTLRLKEESKDFLEEDTLRQLIHKYSQFINFPIYLWSSRTEEVEEPVDDEVTPAEAAVDVEEKKEEKKDDEEEAKVEEEKEDKKKTRKVEKTIWEWQLLNTAKPIWQRKQNEITDEEYSEFYRSITKDTNDPLAKTHFVAEGEVTFKSLLYVPKAQPNESFNRYGGKNDHIKLYVRRVFITDDFQDMMPSYLNFVRGVVDSDDLPLNVSRETLQQHKLLKVIKKKLVRKVLDMLKKISDEDYEKFWKEYSTNVKLGVIEDTANRTRLAKLLRFQSSKLEKGKLTSLSDYVKRMKDKQDYIYYMAGSSYEEVTSSPFIEKLLKKGYEILYLTDAVDEYCISALPEFDGKKFQNVAKEGLKIAESEKLKEKAESRKKEFEPLTKWLEKTLSDKIAKAQLSERLEDSPCALVASQFGWTGNMERLAKSNAHSKTHDVTREYYLSQKKTLEINGRHPIIRDLLQRVLSNEEDEVAKNTAQTLFDLATMRSGFTVTDSVAHAGRVETLLKKILNIDENATVEEDETDDGKEDEKEEDEKEEVDADGEIKEDHHEEL